MRSMACSISAVNSSPTGSHARQHHVRRIRAGLTAVQPRKATIRLVEPQPLAVAQRIEACEQLTHALHTVRSGLPERSIASTKRFMGRREPGRDDHKPGHSAETGSLGSGLALTDGQHQSADVLRQASLLPFTLAIRRHEIVASAARRLHRLDGICSCLRRVSDHVSSRHRMAGSSRDSSGRMVSRIPRRGVSRLD
jgi:hypothetical protein